MILADLIRSGEGNGLLSRAKVCLFSIRFPADPVASANARAGAVFRMFLLRSTSPLLQKGHPHARPSAAHL